MSGLSSYVALAGTLGKAFKLLQTVVDTFNARQTKEDGATAQREEDLKNETKRNNDARDAGADPAVDDPSGVLTDPANRFNKGGPGK